LATKYVIGPRTDEVLAQKKGKQTRYFLRDGLGSTRELTTKRGKVRQRYNYDAFGALSCTDVEFDDDEDCDEDDCNDRSGTPKTNYLFAGREFQPESGLYNYRQRFYHPEIGRFVQADPIGFEGGDVNIYAYVSNNPITRTDPFGLDFYSEVATVYKAAVYEYTIHNAMVGASLSQRLGYKIVPTVHTPLFPIIPNPRSEYKDETTKGKFRVGNTCYETKTTTEVKRYQVHSAVSDWSVDFIRVSNGEHFATLKKQWSYGDGKEHLEDTYSYDKYSDEVKCP
jgi:RHS repeat-associated protein